MRRIPFLLICGALAACGGDDRPPAERPAKRAPLFGFNLASATDAAQTAQLAAAAGANSARITINWQYVAPAGPGRIDLDRQVEVYRASRARGLRPILVLYGTPRWALPAGARCEGECRRPPARRHEDEWQRFVARVARTFPDAAAIEVWNEPNEGGFWQTPIDPRRYVRLLRLAFEAVRRVDRSMPVLGGALTANPSERRGADRWGMRPFLEAMYAAGAARWMDGLSIHPYPSGLGLGHLYRTLTVAEEARDRAGDDAPLWITETGASTGSGLSEDQQAVLIAEVVERVSRRRGIAAVIVHTLFEPSWAPPGSLEHGYGVVRGDGSAKPAWCALARVRGREGGCPAPRPDSAQTELWRAQALLQSAVDGARAHRAEAGGYADLTPRALRRRVPALRPVSDPDELGLDGDPAEVLVTPIDRARGLLLCNASKPGRSFCVLTRGHGRWLYGAHDGGVEAAATATLRGVAGAW